MENNKDNKKFEELSDEQLKKVAGGHIPPCPSPGFDCLMSDDDCKCTKCCPGYTLIEDGYYNTCVHE